MSETCPFCHVESSRIVAESELCLALRDRFPVASGHVLIVPRRHIASFQDMTPEEWQTVHELAVTVGNMLVQEDWTIKGFNIGINDGQAAGQTVLHAHVHLIPRRVGDVDDPRGGVRHLFPGKGSYP